MCELEEKKRIVVAMSGGVDSSVAAALLKEQGHDVIGITMQIWDHSDSDRRFGTCCSLEDVYDARRVAEGIGIPFYVMNLEKEFREEVVNYFIREYMSGATPNPCVPCNQRMKFHFLLKRALELGADFLATGHYASVVRRGGRLAVRRGMDPQKDQSYFLFNLTQKQLEKIVFPLGDLTKPRIRELARGFGLSTAEKEESQEICFVAEDDYGAFLKKELGEEKIQPGPIVNARGERLGTHKGTPFYTIGQRKGLGIAAPAPLYVTGIHPETREIVVGEREELYRREFEANRMNWYMPPEEGWDIMESLVRIRYRGKETGCEVSPLGPDRIKVRFKTPQPAVTPGQAAVFYDKDLVVGGGWISGAEK
ncbi:MAG: tRNA 2-thiouridine(34) synthase MnmA [Nitrospinae bacterium]|nr:tRNA 2-thiouridine(34) synthase MnmA [Nitrospinota bacterium]